MWCQSIRTCRKIGRTGCETDLSLLPVGHIETNTSVWKSSSLRPHQTSRHLIQAALWFHLTAETDKTLLNEGLGWRGRVRRRVRMDSKKSQYLKRLKIETKCYQNSTPGRFLFDQVRPPNCSWSACDSFKSNTIFSNLLLSVRGVRRGCCDQSDGGLLSVCRSVSTSEAAAVPAIQTQGESQSITLHSNTPSPPAACRNVFVWCEDEDAEKCCDEVMTSWNICPRVSECGLVLVPSISPSWGHLECHHIISAVKHGKWSLMSSSAPIMLQYDHGLPE